MTDDIVENFARTVEDILRSLGVAEPGYAAIKRKIPMFFPLRPEDEVRIAGDERLAGKHSTLSNFEFGTSVDEEDRLFVNFHYFTLREHGEGGCDRDSLQELKDALNADKNNADSDGKETRRRYRLNPVRAAKFRCIVVILVRDHRAYCIAEQRANSLHRRLKHQLSATNEADISLTQIAVQTVLVPNPPAGNQFHDIAVASRVESLEYETSIPDLGESGTGESAGTGIVLRCMVFTASLNDVLGLYGQLGDALFAKNLRYQVKERHDNESVVGRTTGEYPDPFWSSNNGISLIVPNADNLKLGESGHISLKLSEQCRTDEASNLLNGISVIDGADIITSSFALDAIPDSAKVLLRVYTFIAKDGSAASDHAGIDFNHLSKNEREAIQRTIDDVAIAWNRQEPVGTDDVSLTSGFVRRVNAIRDIYDAVYDHDSADFPRSDLDAMRFEIVRRGDTESIFRHRYLLANFARVMKSIQHVDKLDELVNTDVNPDEPDEGTARSIAVRALLKREQQCVDAKDVIDFTDTEVFISKLAGDESFLEQYYRKYRYVNLAFRVSHVLDAISAEHKVDSDQEPVGLEVDVEAFRDNGKYYALTHIVHQLIGGDGGSSAAIPDDLDDAVRAYYDEYIGFVAEHVSEIKRLLFKASTMLFCSNESPQHYPITRIRDNLQWVHDDVSRADAPVLQGTLANYQQKPWDMYDFRNSNLFYVIEYLFVNKDSDTCQSDDERQSRLQIRENRRQLCEVTVTKPIWMVMLSIPAGEIERAQELLQACYIQLLYKFFNDYIVIVEW